jgi:succinylarginine dihydrolase
MTRQEQIASFGDGTRRLTESLKKYPKEFYSFKPASEKWSAHEVIVHLADSEAVGYTRFRRALAEPGLSVFAYDENKWAKFLRYDKMPTEDALQLFSALRKANHTFFASLKDDEWDRSVLHPENGNVALDWQLNHYDEHVNVHIRQIERNWKAWQEAGKG